MKNIEEEVQDNTEVIVEEKNKDKFWTEKRIFYLSISTLIWFVILNSVFSFLDNPLYENFRLVTPNTILALTFYSITLLLSLGIGFYLYKQKELKIWKIIILSSVSITLFVNVLAFLIVPALFTWMLNNSKYKLWKAIVTSSLSLFILPLAIFSFLLIWASATAMSKDETTSYAIKQSHRTDNNEIKASDGRIYSMFTWNIGYASTGSEADYFYDKDYNGKRGTWGKAQSKEQVMQHMKGINQFIKKASLIPDNNATDESKYNKGWWWHDGTFDSTTEENHANENQESTFHYNLAPNQGHGFDFGLIQEVDRPSVRSFYTDQPNMIMKNLKGYDAEFVNNWRIGQVPAPFLDPGGQVDAGLMTISRYNIDHSKARRVSLNSVGSGLNSIFNLKRAMGLTEYKVINKNNEEKTLHIFNVHMSAFPEDAAKREKEMDTIKALIAKYKKDNDYYIFGGDWNADIMSKYFYDKHKDDDTKPNSFKNSVITTYGGKWPWTTLEEAEKIENYYNPRRLFAFDIAKTNKDDKLPFYSGTNVNNPSARYAAVKWKGFRNTIKNYEDKKNSDYAIIDGFIVSSNIALQKNIPNDTVRNNANKNINQEYRTFNESHAAIIQQYWNSNPWNKNYGFSDSDHNPVFIQFKLN